MSESNNQDYTGSNDERGLPAHDGPETASPSRLPKGVGERPRDGWQAYKNWLSRVTADERKRAPLDPAVYTWKGYHRWADEVKRSWKSDT